jgi:hypothetical protein
MKVASARCDPKPFSQLTQAFEQLIKREGAGSAEQLEALLVLGSAQRAANDLAAALVSHQDALAPAQTSHVLGDYGLAIAHAQLALSYVQIDSKLAKTHAELARPLLQQPAPGDVRLGA